jgi:RNA recognition motif-containing protein
MTSSIDNNRCKLLVLDLDINKINFDNLRTYFSSYGPVEWIEIFPGTTSGIIYFVNYLTVDHLIKYRTCLIGQNKVRLRRFRLDQNNWHIDSHTLHVKFSTLVYPNYLLTEANLRFCFRDFQSNITKLDIIDDNQALIFFSNYDYVDQILLLPSNMFIINNISLVFERMMEKITKKSRWDEAPTPSITIPVLSARNPVVHKLMNHIEYLTKQLRGKK